jgi:hypothetical protein
VARARARHQRSNAILLHQLSKLSLQVDLYRTPADQLIIVSVRLGATFDAFDWVVKNRSDSRMRSEKGLLCPRNEVSVIGVHTAGVVFVLLLCEFRKI